LSTQMRRIKTGIEGLDPLIEGGFLQGDTILLAGDTGSGKTIFSAQFIHNGAQIYGENGVYVTFEEDVSSFKRNMTQFGFNLDKLEREGKVKILDLAVPRERGISDVIETILKAVDEVRGSRLVIDSISAILTSFKEEYDVRAFTHLIYKLLKPRGCTTLMTYTIPYGFNTLGGSGIEAVVDALLLIQKVVEEKELRIRFLIHKMRGTNHSLKYHYTMVTDKGLKIVEIAP